MSYKLNRIKVKWKVKGIYSDGRYYPKKQFTEHSYLKSEKEYKEFKQHLKEVYGSNLIEYKKEGRVAY
jgi:hypothetical protein